MHGANASENLYSLIETAKTNGLEPYHYLRYVFTELPKAKTSNTSKRCSPITSNLKSLIDHRTKRQTGANRLGLSAWLPPKCDQQVWFTYR